MSMSRPRQENVVPTSSQTDSITMYSTTWCSDCRRAKRIFDALGVPFVEIDIDDNSGAAELVARLNAGKRSVPTILFPDGTKLVEPSNAVLEAKLAPFTGGVR